MGDIMRPIPFSKLIGWIMKEKKTAGSVFGVHKSYHKKNDANLTLFGTSLETPIGPAAGPHTQMAQNIIAAYMAGSRFFELKTVQIMDGEELSACITKPCIDAREEGYNTEWSTELTVPEAYDEYVKAWYAIKLISKEYSLGNPDGYIFNMSVGYDFAGITSPKIDNYIENMMNAQNTPVYQECKEWALSHVEEFDHIDAAYIESIGTKISNSITVSTLHGCPPSEIEKIASYLISEKKLNTFVKCNPTLLGYKEAREILDQTGYDFVQFGEFHFEDDLQYVDAVPMITRLMALSEENQVEFGVKITNTFPVDNPKNVLPVADEMYMSGQSLFPVSIAVAKRLTDTFDGKLKISYSGGADYFNIDAIFETGIWPITVATTLLKPGGYERLVQMAEKLETVSWKEFDGVDPNKLTALFTDACENPTHPKSVKPAASRKSKKQVPLTNCFHGPCSEGCPIHQDIPQYIALAGAGRYEEAFEVILRKNPLPFITGTICSHRCMNHCTRNFYDESVKIRDVKLLAAEKAYDAWKKSNPAKVLDGPAKAAVIGGGPAGMAAAYFLGRSGIKTVLFEEKESLGGIVNHVIPDFRIGKIAIDKDADIIRQTGTEVKLNTKAPSLKELKEAGYTYVLYAVGASKKGFVSLEEGETVNAQDFLREYKKNNAFDGGRHIVVIGGGNTAMDAARAAKRLPNTESVTIVYRRTKRYMPAEEEELQLVMEEGIAFEELAAPKAWKDGILTCEKMELGAPDESGRRSPLPTGTMVEIKADLVISAVGEKVEEHYFTEMGISLTKNSVFTNEENIYVIGDTSRGPATVAEAIADAQTAVSDIICKENVSENMTELSSCENVESALRMKRGILKTATSPETECSRCLECSTICESCVEACPNRANVEVKTKTGQIQIVHMDGMCNECGNCMTFCPYDSAPYKDKFTYFNDKADFEDSTNSGFYFHSNEVSVRLGSTVQTFIYNKENLPPLGGVEDIIEAFLEKYSYMI
ncbi:MAG: putative selenate reductase subunit YgfK [Lachnospiraceae bacterium]|nr:putative selenate reductase subunit YgfK [Lachnospiraceae bacterium]